MEVTAAETPGARKPRDRWSFSQHRPGQLHCHPGAFLQCPRDPRRRPWDRGGYDLPDKTLPASTAAMQLVLGPIAVSSPSATAASDVRMVRHFCVRALDARLA